LKKTGPGTAGIAVNAPVAGKGAVPVGAGKTRINRDFVHPMPENGFKVGV
jgi:hypothetical protein